MVGRVFAFALLMFASPLLSAVEPLTVDDLARSLAASQAMQRGEADVSTYRAGRFDGYLSAVTESLLARGEICLAGCFCHVRERLDPLLEGALADPALERSQPAAPWLAAQLRAAYPCPAR